LCCRLCGKESHRHRKDRKFRQTVMTTVAVLQRWRRGPTNAGDCRSLCANCCCTQSHWRFPTPLVILARDHIWVTQANREVSSVKLEHCKKCVKLSSRCVLRTSYPGTLADGLPRQLHHICRLPLQSLILPESMVSITTARLRAMLLRVGSHADHPQHMLLLRSLQASNLVPWSHKPVS
jgi:hypothetical protein